MNKLKSVLSLIFALLISGCGNYGNTAVPESVISDNDYSDRLVEIIMPGDYLSFTGFTAEQLYNDFEPGKSAFIAEELKINDDGSLSVFCTQEEIDENLVRTEERIKNSIENANNNLVDSVTVNEDYTEVVMGVSDMETFSNTFYLLDIWVECCLVQFYSHPENSEWHLDIIFLNTNTGEIGYEVIVPYETISIMSEDFFANSHDPYYFENEESEA